MTQKPIQKITSFLVLFFAFSPLTLAQIFKGEVTDPVTGETLSDAAGGTAAIGSTLASTGVAGTGDIGDLVLKYVNFSLPYLTLAAFVGFVYAGFLYVTAYGNDDQIQKSKKILIYAVLGLILVILSFSIVQLFTQDLAEGIN